MDRWSGSAASGTHPSCIGSEAPDADKPDTDGGDDSDTGPAGLWNPHTSLKPLEQDGDASDGEVDIEGDLPYISKNQLFLFHLIQSYYILFLLFWG